ncbi:MAG TPA: hypothetical protein VF717_19265, partial [Pyrinomonadaceae bacterium]
MYHDTRNVQIDYRQAEEDFLPYYPQMTDARKVSDKEEIIVCVPVQHFYGSRLAFAETLASFAARRAGRLVSSSKTTGQSMEKYSEEEWGEKRHANRLLRIYEKGVKPGLRGWYLTADLSRLSYRLTREMLRSIRRRARASGLQKVPVIISNHSKDIKDFTIIERFVSELAGSEDIRFLTQTELVGKLESGEFPIRTQARIEQ